MRIEAAVVEKTVPDDSRVIARMLASLQDIGQRLQSLEAQPMLRDTPEQIQQRQAYAVKDAVAAREQLERAAYTAPEMVERTRTGYEQHQWLLGIAMVLCHRRRTL